MEAFLIGIDDRLIQVLVHDDRGNGGAVLTLTGYAGSARLFPVAPRPREKPQPRPDPTPDKGSGPTIFPSLPQGLAANHDVDATLSTVRLDTSDLPGEILTFSLDQFAERAAQLSLTTDATVRLTRRDATDWGLEGLADELQR